MKSIGVLFIVAILTVAASLANMVVIFDRVGTVTGFQASDTDTGTVNLSVTSIIDINFTTKNVSWGSGRVNTGKTKAYLDSKSNTVVDGNWSASGGALVLENIGNVNCTLNVSAGKTAAQFLGGTAPSYQWMFNISEGGSCTGGIGKETFINTTLNTNTTSVCTSLRYEPTMDEIRIYFNLTVPEDSLRNDLGDIITASAYT